MESEKIERGEGSVTMRGEGGEEEDYESRSGLKGSKIFHW